MTRLEDRLRQLPEGYGGRPDVDGALEEVVARGRRKRVRRVTGGVGAATAVLGVVVLVATASTPAGVPRIDPVGPTSEGTSSPSPEPTASPSGSGSPQPTASAVEPLEPRPSGSETGTPSPRDEPVIDPFPPQRMLELSVSTDREAYASGEQVTITIEACNGTDQPHDEFFFEEGNRYMVRILTREDRRSIADTSGRSYEGGSATETWQPGECRTWTEVWDQTEGRFDEQGGQQAEPGDYLVQLDWHGVDPPPPGTDPELYDPAGRDGAASSPFTIEPGNPNATTLPTLDR